MKSLTLKSLAALVLLSLLLLSAVLPSFADVIIEPEDSFFAQHEDECTYQEFRQYIVNTDAGHTYLYVNPESDRTIKGYPNGEKVAVYWLYTDKDGEVWGLLSHSTGWFRMSELTVVYDSVSFLNEHSHEMKPYVDGSYTIVADESKPVVMWKYPGQRSESSFYDHDVTEYVSETYTDPDGEVWGYIQYYMGMRKVWVCLTDPYGDGGVETDEAVTTDLKAEPTDPDGIPTSPVGDGDIVLKADPTPQDKIPMSEGNKRTFIIVGALVGGVVLVTAAVIVVLSGKKSKPVPEQEP